jgi:hypothetical protein
MRHRPEVVKRYECADETWVYRLLSEVLRAKVFRRFHLYLLSMRDRSPLLPPYSKGRKQSVIRA